MSRSATHSRTLEDYANDVAMLLHKGGGWSKSRAKAVVLKHIKVVKRSWNRGDAPCGPSVALLSVGSSSFRLTKKSKGLRLGDAVKSVTSTLGIKQCGACKVRQRKLNNFGAWITGNGPKRKTLTRKPKLKSKRRDPSSARKSVIRPPLYEQVDVFEETYSGEFQAPGGGHTQKPAEEDFEWSTLPAYRRHVLANIAGYLDDQDEARRIVDENESFIAHQFQRRKSTTPTFIAIMDEYDKKQRRFKSGILLKKTGRDPKGPRNRSDVVRARRSLKEERAAIRAYAKRAMKTKDVRLKKIFKHARKEEMQHASMFKKYLRRGGV